MLSTGWTKIVVYLSAALWLAVLALRGVDVDLRWLTALGGVSGAVVIALLAFDQWLWRQPVFRRLAKRRILRGTWRGKLQSTYVDPQTGAPIPPIDVYLVVHQTYSSVSASLLTPESRSRRPASYDDPARGQCLLSGIYMNTPELLRQDRSRIHRGGMILEVAGRPASRLKGFYFTDRDTKGELVFDEYATALFEDFEHARRGDYVRRDDVSADTEAQSGTRDQASQRTEA